MENGNAPVDFSIFGRKLIVSPGGKSNATDGTFENIPTIKTTIRKGYCHEITAGILGPDRM